MLRQMIMSIHLGDDKETPLFHSMDLDYMDTSYTFQYSDKVAEEAECVIKTLIPYIKHSLLEHSDSIYKYFVPEFKEWCENLQFNPEAGYMVDKTVENGGCKIKVDDKLKGFLFGERRRQLIK